MKANKFAKYINRTDVTFIYDAWADLAYSDDPCEATERAGVNALQAVDWGPYDFFIDESIGIIGDQYIDHLQRQRNAYNRDH